MTNVSKIVIELLLFFFFFFNRYEQFCIKHIEYLTWTDTSGINRIFETRRRLYAPRYTYIYIYICPRGYTSAWSPTYIFVKTRVPFVSLILMPAEHSVHFCATYEYGIRLSLSVSLPSPTSILSLSLSLYQRIAHAKFCGVQKIYRIFQNYKSM